MPSVRWSPSRTPWLLALALAAACGGTTRSAGDAGANGDGDGDGASSAETGGSAGGPSPCPSAPADDGSACGPQGLECEWGASNVEECDTVGHCNGGRWQVTSPAAGSSNCGASVDPACPASFGAVPAAGSCASDGLVCDYPQGRCACATPSIVTSLDGSVSPDEWFCQDPGAGCPPLRPRVGSACQDSEAQYCDYGAECTIPGGAVEACTGGIWVELPPSCPH